MDTQFLFAYGTLMSGHPEHDRYCPKPVSVLKAEMPGRLFEIEDAYPILHIPQETVLLRATNDPIADWKQVHNEDGGKAWDRNANWIKGEILELPVGIKTFSKMDAWEGFEPGSNSVYERVIARAKIVEAKTVFCWVYVCRKILSSFKELNASEWKRPD